MITRLSISVKLFAIVSFLFLVIAATGGFAFLQMRAINAAAPGIQAQYGRRVCAGWARCGFSPRAFAPSCAII